MIVIGIILAAHFALWISSLKMTSVASSVILVTAHPVLVAPVSFYFLKEKLSLINALGIAISLGGVGLLVIGNYGFAAFGLDTLEGNILALLGGIAAGLYILGGRTLRKTVSTITYAFVVYAVGTIVLFIMCLTLKAPVYNLGMSDYAIILLMAVVSGIFGHTLYNWSLGYIRASIMSVALLGEPIGSSLLAYVIPWIHQEPSFYTIIGGGIILIGIYLTARSMKEPEILENV
jgi:drug/metabolite transporter (DMT)-like permease